MTIFNKSFSFYRPDVKGILVLVALFLAGALVGNFITLILSSICGQEFVADYSIVITYPCQFIFPMLYAAKQSRINKAAELDEDVPVDSNRFSPVGPFQLAIMVIAGTIACGIITEPICALLPQMPDFIKQLMEMLVNGPLWATILATCVMAPVLEEWLCRGMVMRGMLKRTSPTAAILISAAFFAIIHLNPWQAIPAFMLGCLFGLVYYKTGSLKLTILMHCANNAFSVYTSHRFEGFDYTWQIMDGNMSQYYILYGASIFIAGWLIFRLLKIQFKQQ